MIVRALAQALRLGAAPAAHRLDRALADPAAAQRALNQALVADVADTDYGRHFRVRRGDDLRDRLPIATWEDLAPWLDRARETAGPVLTTHPARFHEPTSGSGGPRKLVPYTDPLLRAFGHMFLAWAHDLVRRGPRFETGGLYFSVSPAPPGEGLADDADYLPLVLRPLFRPFYVAPKSLKFIENPEELRDVLAFHLLAAAHLEIVSVWSPSFLAIVLDHALARLDVLAPALLRGTLGPWIAPRIDAGRLTALANADWPRVWPALKLVSCWADGASAPGAADLATRLPHALLQGKGLLATEAPITVPRLGVGAVPILNAVLLELEDAAGRLHPPHAVERGEYAVIVTTPGGLWRYRLGDRVRVTGHHLAAPILAFAGRADAVTDLVGEKLAEPFVAECLARFGAGFRALLPVAGPPARYRLLTDAPVDAAALDAALAGAFHYAHARRLGQLAAPEIDVDPRWSQRYVDARVAAGQRWGDVKPPALVTRPEDAAALTRAPRTP